MTDLARQRRSYDIWVSRSHLYALGMGMVLFAVACFALGYTAGRRSVDRFEPITSAHLQDQPADDELVELLARVDAAATPDGGLRKLTFPDALAGIGQDLQIVTPVPNEGALTVPGQEMQALALPGELPRGRWTVVVVSLPDRGAAEAKAAELVSLGLEAWVGVERIEGRESYRVALGGHGSRAEAEEALESLEVRIGDPKVVRY